MKPLLESTSIATFSSMCFLNLKFSLLLWCLMHCWLFSCRDSRNSEFRNRKSAVPIKICRKLNVLVVSHSTKPRNRWSATALVLGISDFRFDWIPTHKWYWPDLIHFYLVQAALDKLVSIAYRLLIFIVTMKMVENWKGLEFRRRMSPEASLKTRRVLP